jgi:hypothetical protein
MLDHFVFYHRLSEQHSAPSYHHFDHGRIHNRRSSLVIIHTSLCSSIVTSPFTQARDANFMVTYVLKLF